LNELFFKIKVAPFLAHPVHSSEMHPNNKWCNTVVKDGTNQSHNINKI